MGGMAIDTAYDPQTEPTNPPSDPQEDPKPNPQNRSEAPNRGNPSQGTPAVWDPKTGPKMSRPALLGQISLKLGCEGQWVCALYIFACVSRLYVCLVSFKF